MVGLSGRVCGTAAGGSARGPRRSGCIVLTAKYDDDANVWYVEESNVPGLRTEAPTIEALRAKLPGLIEDLVELNQLDFHGEIPIEVIAHARTTVTIAA